ncbi:MAG: type 1 glutamine amidotransferase [Chthoniobacterales bacterium]
MKILCLQHDPLDGPGSLSEWADSKGHSIALCLICEGAPLPSLESFDLLVSLGGPMGAYEVEKYPWLTTEKEYLIQAAAAGKKLLGLCLGCQLLAYALGGKAFRHTCKEFGWQPIELTKGGIDWFGTMEMVQPLEAHEKAKFLAFQWHGDTYTLPPGAVHLARNEAAEQQAFLLEVPSGGKILGMQFHLEWTEQMAREALAEPGATPPPSRYVQTPEEILSNPKLFVSAKKRFFALLDQFTD